MAQRNPIDHTESLSATGRGNEPIGTGTAHESSTAGTTTHSSTTGGGAAGGVKGVLAGIHGVGEKIRGEFNKGVDGALGDKEGVLKNEQVANAGDRERLTGTFAGETKNREGALPGADGDKRY